MKISKIEISNFRSIKHLIIEPKNLCALIGPNSVGKTNILKAIDLVLGEGWTTKAKIARELFNDVNSPIKIRINFNEPVIYPSGNGYTNSVENVNMIMTLEPELKVSTTINNDQTFYYQDNFKKLCHFVYIPSNRQLSNELRVSNWTLLGKLMKLIHDNYIEHFGNENVLKENFEKEIEPAKIFLENDFNSNTDIVTFKNFVDTFKKYCKSNSAGLANVFEPKLNIYNLNWFYKTLQINIKENYPEKDFDAEDVGSGMQNLLLISIFQTYAELMGGKVIFGIEEPEIFLYPQAQRSLYDSFIKLSENSQIFYTTHNPNFVDAYRADEIEILQKNKEKGTYNSEKNRFLTKDNAEKFKFKIYTHFNTERNEIFFSKKVILVEGDSDKILWSVLCKEKWNIDIDKNGIVIIECSGKGGVNYFIGVCKLMNIDYYAIWDQDNSDEGLNPEIDCLSQAIEDSRGLMIPDNLEIFIKSKFPSCEFREKKKVEDAYNWATNIKTEEIPKEFCVVKEFLNNDNENASIKSIIVKGSESKEIEDEIKIEDIPF